MPGIDHNSGVEQLIMKFSVQAQVVGMKAFTGTVEGKAYDSTTVYCLCDMEQLNEKSADGRRAQRGQGILEFKGKDARIFDTAEKMSMPFEADLLLEKVTANGKARDVLVGIKPRGVVAAAKP